MRVTIDRTKVKVLKHHRTVDVFTDGRYLHVSMKISTHSKRGREIARETAAEILNAVYSSEGARDASNKQADNAAMSMAPGRSGSGGMD